MVDAGVNPFDVAGKTALITGGGSGLGQFMAKVLAEAGARVYLVGRREDRLSASLGDHDGAIFALDLVERGAADNLFDMVSAMDKQPDIIVNAAGINPRCHADDISETRRARCVFHRLARRVARARRPPRRARRSRRRPPPC